MRECETRCASESITATVWKHSDDIAVGGCDLMTIFWRTLTTILRRIVGSRRHYLPRGAQHWTGVLYHLMEVATAVDRGPVGTEGNLRTDITDDSLSVKFWAHFEKSFFYQSIASASPLHVAHWWINLTFVGNTASEDIDQWIVEAERCTSIIHNAAKAKAKNAFAFWVSTQMDKGGGALHRWAKGAHEPDPSVILSKTAVITDPNTVLSKRSAEWCRIWKGDSASASQRVARALRYERAEALTSARRTQVVVPPPARIREACRSFRRCTALGSDHRSFRELDALPDEALHELGEFFVECLRNQAVPHTGPPQRP